MPNPMSRLLACLSLTLSVTLFAQGQMPCIPQGNMRALEALYEQELMYPAVALEAGIKGEVVVGISLDPHGKTLGIRVAHSLSPECDAEALRLIRMVIWRPGVADEDCSGVEHMLSVPFDPGKYKRWTKVRHQQKPETMATPVDTSLTIRSVKELNTQVAPVIPNGMQGLPRYIAQEMRYPQEAFRRSLDGTVELEFVVEPSGTLSNMHVLKEVGGGCNDEAMRLMYRIPWTPGVRNGMRVRSAIQVSIRFNLPNERH